MDETINSMLDDMLNAQADNINSQTEEEEKAKTILGTFREFFGSKSFSEQAEEIRKKYGFSNKTIIENAVASNFIKKINTALNISVKIVGNIVLFLVNLVSSLIQLVVKLSSCVLHKLINILTMKKMEK